MVFFFQAEDGIRDRNVTGVQTCALPSSEAVGEARAELDPVARARGTTVGVRPAGAGRDRIETGVPHAFLVGPRSEERRVGEGCGARGAEEHVEKMDKDRVLSGARYMSR